MLPCRQRALHISKVACAYSTHVRARYLYALARLVQKLFPPSCRSRDHGQMASQSAKAVTSTFRWLRATSTTMRAGRNFSSRNFLSTKPAE